ncbi:hypothetical protein KY362_05505, partial [Candidatus Woesearchaeota archaeon]|nr:hypothetical protein [Candidatus Woesearchaeota archaeon]
YRLRIDEDASEGVNDLTLKYKHGTMEWSKLEDFEVRVRSVDAAVVIEKVTMDPPRIPAGNEGKLTVTLQNLADSVMEDVNVKLDLTLSSIPQPSTGTEATLLYEALPFAPTSSSSEKRISRLKPREKVDVVYDIMVYPDATSRVYKLPIILTYRDELDNEFEKEDIIGVVVGSQPDIYVVIDSSDLVAGRKSGKVSFKFVNKGVTDIKFLDVILDDTDDYDIVSASEEYIGNIDSDDFESVDFTIYLMNNGDAKTSGTVEFPVKMTFKDANNIDYSKDVVLTHKIYTAEEKGQAQGSSAMLIVGAIVVIIVVWIVYRQIMKRRKKKQAKA